ncbi:hypothetical protein AZE42_13122, partial [Rhizopogon vesiculosus]
MAEYTPDSFKPLLGKLVKTPEHFTPEDLKLALHHIFTPDATLPAQMGAFLLALHIARLERRPESLAATAQFLRARSLKASIEDGEADFVVDIVGTGGDEHNTYNVSTTAAMAAAGAGARVIKVGIVCMYYSDINSANIKNKHGSRAQTSVSGSGDLLESLGCSFTAPPFPIAKTPFNFILGLNYQPGIATAISPYRKSLPFKTIFNVIGPLINPARPRGMLLGVFERELGPIFAQCLREGGVERALV